MDTKLKIKIKTKIKQSFFFSWKGGESRENKKMGGYKITNYTKEKAKKMGVLVKPSTDPNKKIDVFDKKGNKIGTCGAIGYQDYPSFIQSKGIEYANERRKLYKMRHEKDRHKKGTNGYWADQLLW